MLQGNEAKSQKWYWIKDQKPDEVYIIQFSTAMLRKREDLLVVHMVVRNFWTVRIMKSRDQGRVLRLDVWRFGDLGSLVLAGGGQGKATATCLPLSAAF
jgi:hypothetical protein